MSSISDRENAHPGRGVRSRLIALAATLATALLTACGGGSGDSSIAPASETGAAMITLQDAAGDFQSYTVDVVSLKLTKANGATVETVPATTRVDFEQLVDLSELISAGQIPSGEYVGATITLDYGNASIIAEDANGGSEVLTPLDVNGNPLTGTLDLTVQLDNRHHLFISRARTARLAFDFNLAASNSVDVANATVTVSPMIQATVVPPADLAVRVRGTLVSADTSANTYTVNVRPFELGSGATGQVVVHTTDTTKYEIDGTAYTGAAGLAALAAEPAATITAAFGLLSTSDFSFTAKRVYAGTSVESNMTDRVRGVVTARNGNLLTVRGATLDRRAGGFEFLRGDVTVSVADATHVTEEGATGNFGIGDISVGQRIWATGTATIDDTTSTATFDATAGHVRLEITPMWGLVTGTVSSPLTLDLRAIDGHNPAIFNFAGTGATAASDASAAAYVADTGTLDLSGLAVGAPARVFGFPVPFGTATGVDFNAQTLESYSQVRNLLFLDWSGGGSANAFPGLMANSTALDLSLDAVGRVHFIQTGPLHVDLLSLASAPQIVGDAMATNTAYVVGHAHARHVENYQAFGDFIAALAGDLGGTQKVLGVVANGSYDANSNVFTADQVAVLLND
ncbi:MAG: hypothetical protein JSR15_00260 [Proteobacteria bacterium]|nr:hypothetical protein [Pseudomonadota bacterium]